MTAPAYATNRKALSRWATERLTLTDREDGGVNARFVYDGSTCSNMGRLLRFLYDVQLGPRDGGYVISAQTCAPDDSTEGFRFMCSYRTSQGAIMDVIDAEKPLLGRPLADVLDWPRSSIAPGCYCEEENRAHKWGLVLETIHFALSQRS